MLASAGAGELVLGWALSSNAGECWGWRACAGVGSAVKCWRALGQGLGERLRARPRLPGGGKVPGGVRLWISLMSLGFVLAALFSHGRQLLLLRLDPQGWLWLLLGVGLNVLSLVVNGLAWGVILRWRGLRPPAKRLIASWPVGLGRRRIHSGPTRPEPSTSLQREREADGE